ncbi:MAG: hypothetical protein KAU17_02770, partial [Spirochaetales bacterium]|nr:hypothetical protein [Spirochaetales bacterium]
MEMEIFYDVENILKSANPKNPNSDNGRHRTVTVRNDSQQGDHLGHHEITVSVYCFSALL